MPTPVIDEISHGRGPTLGGDVVRLTGTGFRPQVRVRFGEAVGEVLRVIASGGRGFVDVRTPAQPPGAVDVVLDNLDNAGEVVAGEQQGLSGAYVYARSALATEADLTRLVRELLQDLKRQLLENASISVSADYVPDSDEDAAVPIAELPSLVLSGPSMEVSRLYSTNELQEKLRETPEGPEVVRRRPPLTVDLTFRLVAASESTVELLNLMAATGVFLERTRTVKVDRDPDDPSQGAVRWELFPVGEFRARVGSGDGVRVFTASFVVRGFDLEDPRTLDFSRPVERHEETFVELTDP